MTINEEDIESTEDPMYSLSEDKCLECEEEIQPCDGNLLMVRRLLKNQPSELEQSQ